MFTSKRFGAAALVALALGGTSLTSQIAAAAEQPIAVENNPPGDIPDSQVFITYSGAGFSMQVPEGWSRNDIAGGARFADKYNFVEVTSETAAQAPTVESVTSGKAAQLAANGHAVTLGPISEVKLGSGPAIRIEYQSNSEPNAVTGKQIRLDRVQYLYFRAGRLITLDMAAPAGADNVDQWLLMANSVTFS